MSQKKKENVLDSFNVSIIEADTCGYIHSTAESIVDHNTGGITKHDGDDMVANIISYINVIEDQNKIARETVSERDGLDIFERVGIAYWDKAYEVRQDAEDNYLEGSRLVAKNMVVVVETTNTRAKPVITHVNVSMYASHYHKESGELKKITTINFSYMFTFNYDLSCLRTDTITTMRLDSKDC